MKKYSASLRHATFAYVLFGVPGAAPRHAAVDAGRRAVARRAARLPLAPDVERLAGVLARALGAVHGRVGRGLRDRRLGHDAERQVLEARAAVVVGGGDADADVGVLLAAGRAGDRQRRVREGVREREAHRRVGAGGQRPVRLRRRRPRSRRTAGSARPCRSAASWTSCGRRPGPSASHRRPWSGSPPSGRAGAPAGRWSRASCRTRPSCPSGGSGPRRATRSAPRRRCSRSPRPRSAAPRPWSSRSPPRSRPA